MSAHRLKIPELIFEGWKGWHELLGEWPDFAVAQFKETETQLERYEFSIFGGKLIRRLVAAAMAPAAEVKPRGRGRAAVQLGDAAASPRAYGENREVGAPGDRKLWETVQSVAIGDLAASPLNPRKHYSEASLKELADTFAGVGILQPLVVRPRACGGYEIVIGHRRYFAGMQAGLETVPVIVRPMSDAQALEIMLIENLQRVDLNPIEEADGLRALLALRNEEGVTIYPTRAAVAAKIGRTVMHVGRMLSLLELPETVRKALEAGRIGMRTASLIGAVPEGMRREFSIRVMNGHGERDEEGNRVPLIFREAENLRRSEYVAQLTGAPFDLADAALVPLVEDASGARVMGGACEDCPLREQVYHRSLCTNPACYHAKVAAHVAPVKAQALDAGAVVVQGEKQWAKYLHHDGTVKLETGMVRLDARPIRGETVGTKEAPAWGEMLRGEAVSEIVVGHTPEGDPLRKEVRGKAEVKQILVIDDKGRTVHLAKRAEVIEAAKLNGYGEYFPTRSEAPESAPERAQSAEKKAEEKLQEKIESALTVAAMEELTVEISKEQEHFGWLPMVELALFHSDETAREFVCQRRGIEVGVAASSEDDAREVALRKYTGTLSADRLPALAVELLLAGMMKYTGVKAYEFVKFATYYGLNMKALRKRVEKEAKGPKEKPAKPPKKDAAPEMVREKILRIAGEKGLSAEEVEKAAARVLGKAVSMKPFEAARGNELTAVLEEIESLEPDENGLYTSPTETIEASVLKASASIRVLELKDGAWIMAEEYAFKCGDFRSTHVPLTNHETFESRAAAVKEGFGRIQARLEKIKEPECPAVQVKAAITLAEKLREAVATAVKKVPEVAA